jgi:Tol biopolymer transport system component
VTRKRRECLRICGRVALGGLALIAAALAASSATGSTRPRVVYCGNGSLQNAASVFVSRSGGRVGALIGYPPGAQGLASISVASGSIRALPLTAGNGPVVWSPDGLWVATHALIGSQAPGGGPPKAPLQIANTETGAVRTVLDADAASGISNLDDWSPDDRRLLVDRFVPANASQPGHGVLQMIDVQSGRTQDLGPGGLGAFSPDGRKIVFAPSDGGLIVLDLVSGQQTRLAGFGDVAPVSWSPDGTAFAYAVRTNTPQIEVFRVATGSARVVGINNVGHFTWSGHSLVWTTGSGITITDTNTGKARTIYPLPPAFATKALGPPQTVPVGILPGQRIVYDLPGGGYRSVSITGHDDERLLACRGYEDKVIGSQLNDLIYVRNGTRDTVDCKAGNDVVVADRYDSIARNCETAKVKR